MTGPMLVGLTAADLEQACTKTREQIADEAEALATKDVTRIVRIVTMAGGIIGANAITHLASSSYERYAHEVRMGSLDRTRLAALIAKGQETYETTDPAAGPPPAPTPTHLRAVPLEAVTAAAAEMARNTEAPLEVRQQIFRNVVAEMAKPQTCGCGRVSTHESGWCGTCAPSEY